MTFPTLGIMVAEKEPPFQESMYYKRMQAYGSRQKLNVIVFSAASINWDAKQVNGFRYHAVRKEWQERKMPLPHVIYDRMFHQNVSSIPRELASNVKRLREQKPSRLLGNPIAGKWRMQCILRRNSAFKKYLPATTPYYGSHSLTEWLQYRREAVLKPVSGSHGSGILHIKMAGVHEYDVKGRDANNQLLEHKFTASPALYTWIKHFINNRPYIIQQYLELLDHHEKTYDIRALVQKNQRGLWQLTGTAVRTGSANGFTSNLRGGGKAAATVPYLQAIFPKKTVLHLYESICRLSAMLPPFLESYFGRLAELGIDFGVDRSGRLWILEVNSKPGRSVFQLIGDQTAKRNAIMHPLNYARYLVDRQLGG